MESFCSIAKNVNQCLFLTFMGWFCSLLCPRFQWVWSLIPDVSAKSIQSGYFFFLYNATWIHCTWFMNWQRGHIFSFEVKWGCQKIRIEDSSILKRWWQEHNRMLHGAPFYSTWIYSWCGKSNIHILMLKSFMKRLHRKNPMLQESRLGFEFKLKQIENYK